MAGKKIYDITLRLTDLEHLFTKPDLSPLSKQYREYSHTAGIEYIADELYANTSYEQVHTTLILPQNEIASGLEQEIKAAVKRYCQGRLKDIEHDIEATHWRGTRALFVSFIALFVFIGASRLVYDDNSLIRQIISEGLSIAGWVALWFPLELLTFTIWRQRLDKKIYTMLMNMAITIRAEN